MPFFQGAKDFEIRGGNFYDVNGDQHNHKHDHSFNVSGTGNTATFAPNLSRQDNRTYNHGYSNTEFTAYHAAMTKHAGFPQNNQNNPFPGVPEDYQKFLAWQQQGSPMPPFFQPQTVGGPTSPQFTHPQANGFNEARGPQRAQTTSQFQTYPQPRPQQSPPIRPQGQPQFPPHSSSFPPPPPSQPSRWGNLPNPGYQPQYPPPTDRSYSQPLPNSFDALSEQSEILAEPDDAMFPGMTALHNLEERFRRQAQVSGDASSPPAPRAHSAPAPPPNPSIPTTNQPTSPLSSPSQHQGTTMPAQTPSVSTCPPNSSQQAPPPPNIATKPRPTQLSTIPAPATASPSQNTQAPPPVTSTTQYQHHRPSSSSSSSSSNSSHDNQGPTSIPVSTMNNPQPTMPTPPVPLYRPTSMPTPSVPIYGPSSTPPIRLVADASPPLSSPPNIGTSPPSSHETPTASPPSTLYPQPPLPHSSAASPPILPGATDPTDIFSQLTPLTNAIPSNISGPSEPPKKKGFLAKIKLRRKPKVRS